MSGGVPFNRLTLDPDIESEVCSALADVVRSGWFLLGERLKRFETELAASLCAEVRALGCNSGTDALRLAMLCEDIGPGDEVITVSHTAIPTVLAIASVGATPRFVDIDPESWVMNVDTVPAAVTANTRAVIPVHLYGNMVDVPALKQALVNMGRTDIAVIEDVAQAHGSTLRGSAAGTLGEFGAMSFYPTKNLGALGDAGAIVTYSEARAQRISEIRNCGQASRYEAAQPIAMNSRLDELQAAALSVKLRGMASAKARKDAISNRYRTQIEGPISFQRLTDGADPHWHLCVIQVQPPASRDALAAYLSSREIGTLIHYPKPNHTQAAFRQYATAQLPHTEHVASTILSIPLYAELEDAQVDAVIGGISDFFR